MQTVEEAFHALIQRFRPLPAERVDLRAAAGRVLAADVVAPFPNPLFDNSAMDGYAVRFADCEAATTEAPVRLRVIDDIPAGRAPGKRLEAGTAIRIMTGAPLPEGAEAVVMREDTREHGDAVEILLAPERGENLRLAGEEIAVGTRVFAAGDALGPAALGVLATLGVSSVEVVRQPRIALLSTGDELVELDLPLTPGQIRNSTAYALEALVAGLGARPINLGIARDDREDLRLKLGEGARHDLLITTGGVSVGDHDLVKEMLTELGEVGFWRVNMQPGKPLAFGSIGDTPVIGLPGNPVSSLVAFELFVRPAIRRLQGHAQLQRPRVAVTLQSPFQKKGDRRQFVRAKVTVEAGAFVAHIKGPQGSHMLTSLVRGNALLDLPPGPRTYASGETVQAILLEEGEAYACSDPDGQ